MDWHRSWSLHGVDPRSWAAIMQEWGATYTHSLIIYVEVTSKSSINQLTQPMYPRLPTLYQYTWMYDIVIPRCMTVLIGMALLYHWIIIMIGKINKIQLYNKQVTVTILSDLLVTAMSIEWVVKTRITIQFCPGPDCLLQIRASHAPSLHKVGYYSVMAKEESIVHGSLGPAVSKGGSRSGSWYMEPKYYSYSFWTISVVEVGPIYYSTNEVWWGV